MPPPPSGKTGWPWDEETDPAIYCTENYFPKISIVTPSYNQGEYIEQTIRSVLLQNYPDIQYIIIDGGSSDKTIEIIKKYEPWIYHWESGKDRGQSHAINKGIGHCTGEIFNWINSDDYYNPDCFKNLAGSFDSGNVHAVAGNYRYFDENKNRQEKVIGLRLKPTLEETLAFVLMDQPSTFFRLKIINELGGLDERYKYVMDQDLWKKFLFRYGMNNIKVTEKELAHFRLHGESKTYKNSFSKEYHGIFYSIAKKTGLNKHAEIIAGEYELNVNDVNEFKFDFKDKDILPAKKVINYLIYFLARSYFTKGEYKKSAEYLSAADSDLINTRHISDFRKLKAKLLLIKFKMSFLIKESDRAALINKQS